MVPISIVTDDACIAVVRVNARSTQEDLKRRLQARQDMIDDVITEITPVLNLLDPETDEADRQITRERYPSPERFMHRCRSAL